MITKAFMVIKSIPSNSTSALRLIIACLLLTSLAACGKGLAHKDSAPEKPSGPAAAVQTTSHQGLGTVKALNLQLPSIEIDHGDIDGLMPAMQMEFHVKDKSLLNGLATGDRIEFTVEDGVGGLKVTAIKKV